MGELPALSQFPTPTPAPPAPVLPSSLPVVTAGAVTLAEAALQSGEFVVTIDYGGGRRSVATWRFDLGNDNKSARLQLITVFTGVTGVRTSERVLINEEAWERTADGQWQLLPFAQPVAEQISALLPNANRPPSGLAATSTGTEAVLRWYDAERAASIET